MKRTFLISLVIVIASSLSLAWGEEKEFVYTGNPLVRHLYTADPSARVWADGRLYVYPSQDQSPPRGCDMMDKYHVFSTDDMVNWVDHGQILEAADVPWMDEPLETDGLPATFMWAPDCVYKDGKYYFYYPHPNKNPWNNNWKIGIAVSDKPASDFVSLDYWLKGLPDNGEIDPNVFIDDDGQAYFYYGGGGRCYGAKLKDTMDEIDGELQQMTNLPSFHEGAWVFKRNDLYYLMYPASAGSPNGDEMRYSTSNHPLGPWTYRGVVLKPTGCGTSHGSIVEYKGEWYIFYHNQMLSGNGTLRSICFDKVHFNENGTMQLVTQTHDIGQPYKGTYALVPGTIEAEDFNEGKAPYAYKDNSTGNTGDQYRYDVDVDISYNRRHGIYYVSNTADGEYINYSFEAEEEGTYEIDFYIAAAANGTTQRFHLEFDFYKPTNIIRYSAPYAAINEIEPLTVTNINLSKGKHHMTFYPEGDLNFDKFTFRCVSSAIDEVRTGGLTVFPNPSSGQYSLTAPQEGSILVSDINGRTILKEAMNGHEHTLNLTHYPAGVYILSVETGKQTYRSKLIKQ